MSGGLVITSTSDFWLWPCLVFMFCTEGYVFEVHVCTRTTPHADFKPILRIKKASGLSPQSQHFECSGLFQERRVPSSRLFGPIRMATFLVRAVPHGPCTARVGRGKSPFVVAHTQETCTAHAPYIPILAQGVCWFTGCLCECCCVGGWLERGLCSFFFSFSKLVNVWHLFTPNWLFKPSKCFE